MTSTLNLIPQIWTDTLNRVLTHNLLISALLGEEWKKEHQERMRTDPDYALRVAENETESYWIALYDNQRVTDDEDDW